MKAAKVELACRDQHVTVGAGSKKTEQAKRDTRFADGFGVEVACTLHNYIKRR